MVSFPACWRILRTTVVPSSPGLCTRAPSTGSRSKMASHHRSLYPPSQKDDPRSDERWARFCRKQPCRTFRLGEQYGGWADRHPRAAFRPTKTPGRPRLPRHGRSPPLASTVTFEPFHQDSSQKKPAPWPIQARPAGRPGNGARPTPTRPTGARPGPSQGPGSGSGRPSRRPRPTS